jgi:hypothetical protein
MRYTLRSAINERHKLGLRENLVGWWEEWPPRRKAFWHTLLLEPGQGWLRWAIEERTEYAYIDEGLYRLYWWLKNLLDIPRLYLIGFKDDTTGRRERLSYEESHCSWADFQTWYRDKDRKRELWGVR